jgi:hypothetical protein
VGRNKKNFDTMSAGFPAETFDRIERVLLPDEDRKEFVRVAVENELIKREKRKGRSSSHPSDSDI